MEEIAKLVTLTVSHTVEGLAAVMIGLAMLQVLFSYIRQWGRPRGMLAKEQLRLQFGSSVAVALELLLGADVLSTAVAPSWNDIGKLAAIAVIRTALNYFLERDLVRLGKEPKVD